MKRIKMRQIISSLMGHCWRKARRYYYEKKAYGLFFYKKNTAIEKNVETIFHQWPYYA